MAQYASPSAGLPPQSAIHTGRAVFTEAYAVIPHGVMRDIVTSYLPNWSETRAWIIARPMTGFPLPMPMRRALDLAVVAAESGEVPVGAVITLDGDIISPVEDGAEPAPAAPAAN